jgi:pimeloyl-ACP methyl ester carboxylesterase
VPFLTIDDKNLEYEWHGPPPNEAPTLVFLHDGLGSVAMWRDFPRALANTTGYGAFVYSRAGYGNSDCAELPRLVRFMHDEALETLPKVLDALQIRDAILVGHSDGGSIAIIYAGATNDERVRALILEAPHVFVEDLGIESIRALADSYRNGDLRSRLARYHKRVDETFWGWNDIWLAPEFRAWNIEEYLPTIAAPVLLIQGSDDRYGTLAQVRAIETGCSMEVETVLLPNCGHSPHSEQPERVLEVMSAFVRRMKDEG